MIDYNDEMEKNWMRRLEHQRAEERKAKAYADRVERIVMTLLWAFGLTALLATAYWLGTMKRLQPVSLTITVPGGAVASPTVEATPEPEAESTFGTPQGASIIASTEPPTLRTVQNHPPSSRTVKTVPRSIMEPAKGGPWQRFYVTGYSHGCTNPRSGKEPKRPQKQSSGSYPVPNWTVAAPPDMVPGTVIELSYRGILTTRIVGDTGPDIVRKPGRLPRLDLFMADCERAKSWGHHVVDVREIRRPLGRSR